MPAKEALTALGVLTVNVAAVALAFWTVPLPVRLATARLMPFRVNVPLFVTTFGVVELRAPALKIWSVVPASIVTPPVKVLLPLSGSAPPPVMNNRAGAADRAAQLDGGGSADPELARASGG